MKIKVCKGFSLVELMVAMVVGLVIILGAGKLLLTVFNTNRQVGFLSEKQAAITFIAMELVREVQRGDFDADSYRLSRADKKGSRAVIEKKDGNGSFQALVSGLMMPENVVSNEVMFTDSSVLSISDGVVTFYFYFEAMSGGRELVSFSVVNREEAVAGS